MDCKYYRETKRCPMLDKFREAGARGGKKSRRTITPEQQRKMQEARKRKGD